MESLSLCRICLATDVRLCTIASHLQDMYERITSLTFKREDRRPLACYICHARLHSCYRLRTSCLRSEELLTDIMSSDELKPQDVLSTNTLSIASVLQLSLGHELQESAECHKSVKEEVSEIIHDVERDQHCAQDIKIEPQEEYDIQLDDNNQCPHLEDPLDVIKSEPDDVKTDDEDIQLETEDTFAEKKLNVANICPKFLKVVLQRIDVNDSTTGACVVKDTEDATNNKRKREVEKNEETGNIIIIKPKIVTEKTRFEKPVTTSKIFKSYEKLDIKLNKCENVVTSIVNNVCEEKSTNDTSLEHNVNSISISNNKQFSCDTCKKCFGYKCDLKTHIRTHTGEKPHVCNLCKKCFGQLSSLKIHIRTHTGEKPYVCNFCKKCFKQKRYLINHIRLHTGEKPYACHVCKKCFNKKSYLINHIRAHTGEKPHVCNQCKKCFGQLSSLKIHIRTHTGEKPYVCNFCKKCFKQKSYLINHIRIHTGEKPYACHVCKKCFNQKSYLINHIRIHTGEKPYACHVCKKCFNQKSYLGKHIRLHNVE